MLSQTPTLPAELNLDGIAPRDIVTPRDADELARTLAECDEQKRAVVPNGGATLQHLGNPPTRADRVIQTSALNQVVEYTPEDLTITVQAGMTLAQIQQTLAVNKQFLPLDAPQPERATIGGILAAGASGPLRLRYGPPRDFTLGLRFATVEGKIIKAGGKVVKNVAGYELAKVVIGSLGTLGIITEATFKIIPTPEQELTLVAAFDDAQPAAHAITLLWNLPIWPLALELFDPTATREIFPQYANRWTLAARFGGAKTTMRAAREQAAPAVGTRAVEFFDNAEIWRAIADLPHTLKQSSPTTVLRVGIAPKELFATLGKIRALAASRNISTTLFAHAAQTIIFVAFDAEAEAAGAFVNALRAELKTLNGYAVVEHAPIEIKRAVDVWGEVGPSLRLMQSIKKQFDPNGILNPGRLAGGI